MVLPDIPPELLNLLKVGGGTALGVVGKALTDRRKAAADKAEMARGLTACTTPMLAELERAARNLERAQLSEAPAVAAFFGLERALLPPRDVEELTKRVRENNELDQGSLAIWRAAESLIVEAQTVYANLRERSVLPGESQRIAAQVPALQQLVSRARSSLLVALSDLRRYAPRDTRALLAKHTNDS